ncbi:HD domain-containing protein [Candidatus Thiosymbion oneisti]|uniref:HD domain-containing protein n=1 Tax=Candidatus Thiosymbion oneisti TaxID=589554 RepID=UPI000A8DB526|nr:HD domain-containing protein [Candidatus Thiosymbion oneisti]
MPKNVHEIRDPIHVFVRLSNDERKVLDSRPFQRLRHIHQLGLTYLVYPGATHRRFEHSLGVMELAERVYDVVTGKLTDDVRNEFPDVGDDRKREYWRCVLRMAALCHDIGHLPFSHAAEKKLLPEGWNHEALTAQLIRSDEMYPIWKGMKIDADDVVKLALGRKELPDVDFTPWETILAEIIVGDAFGVDRMDYLLRDSHHAGVAYGKFDQYRLIDTLRILPRVPTDVETGFALGLDEGGIQSAEALMSARYFMYSQLYFHPIRRIYDIHLQEFLLEWQGDDGYPTDVEGHLRLTDAEVMQGIREAEQNADLPGHLHARRVSRRKHFKLIYSHNPIDAAIDTEAGRAVFRALSEKFGADYFRHDRYRQGGNAPEFPVRMRDGRVSLSSTISAVLTHLPVVDLDSVFADRAVADEAKRWLRSHRNEIIRSRPEGDTDG